MNWLSGFFGFPALVFGVHWLFSWNTSMFALDFTSMHMLVGFFFFGGLSFMMHYMAHRD